MVVRPRHAMAGPSPPPFAPSTQMGQALPQQPVAFVQPVAPRIDREAEVDVANAAMKILIGAGVLWILLGLMLFAIAPNLTGGLLFIAWISIAVSFVVSFVLAAVAPDFFGEPAVLGVVFAAIVLIVAAIAASF